MTRTKISHLMDAETWMDANSAIELGFADEIMKRSSNQEEEEKEGQEKGVMLFSQVAVTNSLMDKVAKKCHIEKNETHERSVSDLMERLDIIKNHI